jgi:hypothetical protein
MCGAVQVQIALGGVRGNAESERLVAVTHTGDGVAHGRGVCICAGKKYCVHGSFGDPVVLPQAREEKDRR